MCPSPSGRPPARRNGTNRIKVKGGVEVKTTGRLGKGKMGTKKSFG